MSCSVAILGGDVFWGHLDPSPKYWALDRSCLFVWLKKTDISLVGKWGN